MGLKQQVEEICKEVLRTKEKQFVYLPESPKTWDSKKVLERLYQLAHLIKRNGCEVMRIPDKNAIEIYPGTNGKSKKT